MSTETLTPEITETDQLLFPVPETAEEFIHDLRAEKGLIVKIEQVGQPDKELPSQVADEILPLINFRKFYWRGLDPAQPLALLEGKIENIPLNVEIESGQVKQRIHPNASTNWRTAMSYGSQVGRDPRIIADPNSRLKYNLAVGFVPNQEMKITRAEEYLSDHDRALPGLVEMNQPNVAVVGRLKTRDIRWLILREHGDPQNDQPEQPGRVFAFRVKPREIKTAA